LEWKEGGVIEEVDKGSQKILIFEEEKAYAPRSGTPPPPPSAREQKRTNKQGTPKKDRQDAKLVGSGEEHRREQ
jgi:hypothetical protein